MHRNSMSIFNPKIRVNLLCIIYTVCLIDMVDPVRLIHNNTPYCLAICDIKYSFILNFQKKTFRCSLLPSTLMRYMYISAPKFEKIEPKTIIYLSGAYISPHQNRHV